MRPWPKNEAGYDREFNQALSSLRVEVEHSIKTLKDYKALRYLQLREAEGRFRELGNLLSAALNLEPLA